MPVLRQNIVLGLVYFDLVFNLSLRNPFVTRSVLFRKQSKLFIDLISGGSKITFANREAKLVSVWL